MIKEDLINTEEWTTKELVKHIYRELQRMDKSLLQLTKDVSDLKDDLKLRKDREEEQRRQFNRRVAIVGMVGVILGFVIDLALGFFK